MPGRILSSPLHFIHFSLFLFTAIIPSDSLTVPSDIAALQAFKASIKPSTIPPWSCLASWNFSTDPCSLPRRAHFLCGLSCSPDSTRITSIALDSVGYSGTLSPVVSTLAKLEILDLSDNSFYGIIPHSLSSLSLLQTFSLHRNSFSGSFPRSIVNLKSLEELDISGNFLSGSLPNTLFSLSSLRRLDLSFNKFTGSLPKMPPNLLELAAKANSLSGPISKTSFVGLIHLEVVDLSCNSFAGVLRSWFFQLPSLQQVNLSNNSLTALQIWKPNNGYSELVAVDLGFNQIEGYVPVNLSDYPTLSSLSMRYNRLRGPIPWQFGKMGTLKRLYLDGNYLIGKPPAGLLSGDPLVAGSLSYNCLQGCPASTQLCSPSQKPTAICKQAYGRRYPRSS